MGALEAEARSGSGDVRERRPGWRGLLGQSGPISINPGIYPKLSYDPEKDLVPVSMTTSYPYVLVVNPSLPVHSVRELHAWLLENA